MHKHVLLGPNLYLIPLLNFWFRRPLAWNYLREQVPVLLLVKFNIFPYYVFFDLVFRFRRRWVSNLSAAEPISNRKHWGNQWRNEGLPPHTVTFEVLFMFFTCRRRPRVAGRSNNDIHTASVLKLTSWGLVKSKSIDRHYQDHTYSEWLMSNLHNNECQRIYRLRHRPLRSVPAFHYECGYARIATPLWPVGTMPHPLFSIWSLCHLPEHCAAFSPYKN